MSDVKHFHRLCSLDELTDPGAREFFIGEGEWPLRGFVVRYRDQVRAYLNRCPHANFPLNFKPDVFFAPHAPLLLCTAHGALFAPDTGLCVAGPCSGLTLQTLPICRKDNAVYLLEPISTLLCL